MSRNFTMTLVSFRFRIFEIPFSGINYFVPVKSRRKDRVFREVKHIMDAKGITTNLKNYEVAMYGPLIQDWVDEVFGRGHHRIVVYDKNRNVYWQGNDIPVKTILPILKNEDSYEPIRPVCFAPLRCNLYR